MDEVTWEFLRRYAESGVWWHTRWLGTDASKCPFDLWIYQEILSRTRPDVIIETGTLFGGSALYLASMCDLLDNGRVITIDIEEREDRPRHPRILYLTGSSVAPEVVAQVKDEIADTNRVMVILDSDHHDDHVLSELHAYGPLVTEGCYLIVEDTLAGFSPERWGAGPSAAIEKFMSSSQPFVADPSCEKFVMTFNPGGYLQRLQGPAAQPG
jgi:cephalosporin hydroxylase